MMRFSQKVEREIVGWDSPPVHDLCPVAWLAQPALFELKPCRIAVEIQSELTRGHTAVEFREGVAGALPHRWVTKADADGVFGLLVGACA
jgi:purine nucleosidase